MRIHLGLSAARGQLASGMCAIGNFDGVHLGHRELFATARMELDGARSNGPICALTFQPHPARLLAPAMAPPLIATHERKRELLEQAGIEELVEQPFDREFASLPPEEFVELLCATGIAGVVIGADFTYGRARTGNVQSLRRALEERGVRLHVVPQVTHEGLVISSSKIRELILAGKVDAAAALLGRPFDLDGEVVRGAGRGRTLGWPTANIKTANELLPAVGVYAVRARLLDEERAPIAGAANLGLNPTFRAPGAQVGEKSPLMLEVHLLDFAQDLYGKRLRIEFVQRLREERRFPGPAALKAQIAQDVEDARRLLS